MIDNRVTQWVLVRPNGLVIDGPVEMTVNTAMGHNQSRTHFKMSSKWEEYDSSRHVASYREGDEEL